MLGSLAAFGSLANPAKQLIAKCGVTDFLAPYSLRDLRKRR